MKEWHERKEGRKIRFSGPAIYFGNDPDQFLSLTLYRLETFSLAHLEFLCESKVHEFDVTDGVEEEVLRLEIPVDDPPAVQVVKGLDYARCVEAGGAVVKVTAVPGKRGEVFNGV